MNTGNEKIYKTTCSYCGVGCGIAIRKDRKDRLTLEGDKEHPVNRGMLCSKGMNLHYAVQDHSHRLLHPEMRASRHHPLQRVSWDQAIKRAAAVFSSLIRKYGPDAVGFYVSGQCLTEEYYIANKLVKGFIGTNNIDTNSRLCMSTAVSAYTKMLGEDCVPVSYEDIERSDCMLIAGANPAWCHPILFRRMETHKSLNPGVKVIVVDPRKTQTTSLADIHLQIKPGTDVYLYNALGRILIECGDIDYPFIQNHTEGFERYRDEVFQLSVAEAAGRCEVPETLIREAASCIGASKGFLSLWAMGLNQSVIGVKKNFSLISLNLITGQIGKPGAGPFSLTGQPNAMGGREVGGLSTLLAAHRSLQNPVHRKEVQSYWNSGPIADKPGYTATQMIEALERGDLKAIWIICTNPMVSWPDARRAEAALRKARFIVVQDISRKSETVSFADLVLPAAGHFEKEGTMTNSERRISHLDKIVEPPGEALPDVEILCRFASAMGYSGFQYSSPSAIYDEYAGLTRGTSIDISGLNYDRLIHEGTFQWPVPDNEHAGSKRLFTDRSFCTPTRKARFIIPEEEAESEAVSPEHPLILTTGRIRDQWHTMTKTGNVSRLRQHIRKPFLEIHPYDARERDIHEGDVVVVKNGRGRVQVTAHLSEEIKNGVVFLPMHWGTLAGRDLARANNLTSGLTDPVSGEPDFKFTAVEVARYHKPVETIVIAGAGAASYRFICTYRSLNRTDRIHVISKENDPFYNRVLLPEYVNEKLTWEKLQKFSTGEFESLDVTLDVNNEIVQINRDNKTVTDRFGKLHPYDKLILATGSRANLPVDAPATLPGVFTMRTRKDADRLKEHLPPRGHVLVVGGGLLGLELAVSLREKDFEVSILQLGSRLMERQIDNLAAELLHEFIEESGITVYMNDQMIHADHNDSLERLLVTFRSGKKIQTNAIVYAVGTRPNIEYAQEAGLDTARGILVNSHLQSSDPDIFAIGEIAEFEGVTSGITAAAEKQADVLARYLHGDVQQLYEGSVSMNILKLSGMDLCSIGMPEIPPGAKGYEEILFIDKAKRYYKKCIIHDDKLVGAILIGDKNEFAEFKTLIENKTELSEKRLQLLRSGKIPDPVKGKLVCSCSQVGEGNLESLIQKGTQTLSDLCSQSGAGLGCGSCKPEVQKILNRCTIQV